MNILKFFSSGLLNLEFLLFTALSTAIYGNEKYDCDNNISKMKNLSPLNIHGFLKHMVDL
jgi:hypothetical protein